jgi:hypothetical protein
LDGSPSKVTLGPHLGLELLALLGRLALVLFLTVGLAAGSHLHTGMTLDTPNLVRACEGFFFWALALISCVSVHRA